MAKIIIAGGAMVVESSRTLEEIKTLETHRPRALALFDEDGKKETFKVATTTDANGSIGTFGASFGSESKTGTKKAVITMSIPEGVTDAKDYAEKKIGVAINLLNKVEAQFDAALADVKADMDKVRASITVVA